MSATNGVVKTPASLKKLLLENQKISLQIQNLRQRQTFEAENSISTLIQAAQAQSNLTSFNPLIQNNIYAPLTIYWTLLMYMYKTHGLIQTAVDMPVLDAFRGGVEISSGEMDQDDIKLLNDTMEDKNDIHNLIEAVIWARLFGGAGLIVNTDQDPKTPLRESGIKTLEFYPANRWELMAAWKPGISPVGLAPDQFATRTQKSFWFYGVEMDNSRVLTINGKAAPYILRWQLNGWGMSEVERIVEDFNSYLKTREVTYELLEEAKVDVYRMKDFNQQLASPTGTNLVKARVQLMNEVKSFNKAIMMDMVDEFQQKQITFSGLAEVMKQNMIGIASALRMPLTKIFGISASGFNSGEDDIENYNAMVESEVRQKVKPLVKKVLMLRCLQLFGYEPDLSFEFKPLRVMSSVDEETVKTSKQKRYTDLFDRALLDSEEMGELTRKEKLIPIETKMEQGLLDEHPESPMGQEGNEGPGGKKDKPKEKPKEKNNGR